MIHTSFYCSSLQCTVAVLNANARSFNSFVLSLKLYSVTLVPGGFLEPDTKDKPRQPQEG